MRPIDADTLKRHYSWWDENATLEEREDSRSAAHWKIIFDQIVDAQPTLKNDEVSSM